MTAKNRRAAASGAYEPTTHRAVRVVPPRSHWIALTVMMTALAAMLLLGGVINHQVGAEGSGGPHTPLGAAGVPAPIAGGGPVIDTRNGAETSYRAQPGKIALTFDDGPPRRSWPSWPGTTSPARSS